MYDALVSPGGREQYYGSDVEIIVQKSKLLEMRLMEMEAVDL